MAKQEHATSDKMRNRLRVEKYLKANCFLKVFRISKAFRIGPPMSFLLQTEFTRHRFIRHMGMQSGLIRSGFAHEENFQFDVLHIFG